MNARSDLLLEEILDLPAADRSAVVVALIDSLAVGEKGAISEAWRAELLRRREALRSGAVKAAPCCQRSWGA